MSQGKKLPDPELHRSTVASSIQNKHPAVVVFSTPVYCVSRFCGPITDMVQELAHDYSDRADFIHVEIWRDFQDNVINKAAPDWLLRDDDLREPWVFLIGSSGRIEARWDKVATRAEMVPYSSVPEESEVMRRCGRGVASPEAASSSRPGHPAPACDESPEPWAQVFNHYSMMCHGQVAAEMTY